MSPQSTVHSPQSLSEIAQRWLGTPWCANSATRGAGVSCHNLPREIYVEAGLLDESFPRIVGDPRGVTASNEMEVFLDSRPEFSRLKTVDCGLRTQLRPGDLLGLFIPIDAVGRRVKERSVNHLGVMLPNGWFIHVLIYGATRRDQASVPPWQQRIIAAWRPLMPSPPRAGRGLDEVSHSEL